MRAGGGRGGVPIDKLAISRTLVGVLLWAYTWDVACVVSVHTKIALTSAFFRISFRT